MRRAWLIFKKDVTLELAGMRIIPTIIILSILILLVFAFARGQAVENSADAAAMLAITFLFCGLVGADRCFDTESHGGTLEAMRQVTGQTDFIFWGKFCWVLLVLFFVEFWSCLMFSILFDYELYLFIPELIIIAALFNVGFVAISVLFCALTYSMRGRGFLLIIILLPLLIPPIVGMVYSLKTVLQGSEILQIMHWLKFMAGFDVVFGALSVFLFDKVLD